MILVDSNRTKEKIFSQIDSFIEEFVGEDLRRANIRDINKYLNTTIENEVTKACIEWKYLFILCCSTEFISRANHWDVTKPNQSERIYKFQEGRNNKKKQHVLKHSVKTEDNMESLSDPISKIPKAGLLAGNSP